MDVQSVPVGTAGLNVLGGLGLFLVGMTVLTDGLTNVAGPALRKNLRRFTRSPFTGAVTGASITAILQSSSATAVTAVGLAGAGLLTFPQTLGILFGANIGTTITGWFVALLGFKLKISAGVLPLILVGGSLRLFGRGVARGLGLAIAGFGLVFLGIGYLQYGMTGLESVVTPDVFPPNTWGGRALLVLIGLAVTIVTQSSSAGVATAIAAVHSGTLSLVQAASMVVGMDIGTTLTAIVASTGGTVEAKRTGLAHVVYNVMTGVFAFFLIVPFVALIERWSGLADQPELCLVMFHTVFNALGVLAVLPWTGAFARLIERLLPAPSPPHTERLRGAARHDQGTALIAAREAVRGVASDQFLRLIMLVRDEGPRGSFEDAMDSTTAIRSFLNCLPMETEANVATEITLRHALDHVERLAARLEATDHAATVRSDPELAGHAEAVIAAIEPSTPDPIQGSTVVDAARAESAWRSVRKAVEPFRSTALRKAAVDRSATVTERLHAARWLKRVAYHVWRLSIHLREAKPTASPATAEPPSDESAG